MDEPKMHSPVLTKANIGKLAELFPGVVPKLAVENWLV